MRRKTTEFQIMERHTRHAADNAEKYAREYPELAALALEFAAASRAASAAAARLAAAIDSL